MTFYDRDGNPMELWEWALAMEFGNLIDQTTIGNVHISTVWLGIDHSFGMIAKPLIFETMIFGGELDQAQWRWATVEQAQEGHNQIVERVKKGNLYAQRN